jgi:hypothetical protein
MSCVRLSQNSILSAGVARLFCWLYIWGPSFSLDALHWPPSISHSPSLLNNTLLRRTRCSELLVLTRATPPIARRIPRPGRTEKWPRRARHRQRRGSPETASSRDRKKLRPCRRSLVGVSQSNVSCRLAYSMLTTIKQLCEA